MVISKDMAELLFSWGNVVLVISLAFGAASTFVVIQASKEKERYQALAVVEANAAGARAVKEAAQANERAAALEQETVRANLELERLRATVSWRQVTPTQSLALAEAFRGRKMKIWVEWVRDDPEATTFAHSIGEALRSAGIEPVMYSGWDMAVGLQISATHSPDQQFVASTFANVGLPLKPNDAIKPHGEKDVALLVGSKPPPD